jgi:predicted transposase/invertase (TIGR01784 family)
LIDFLNSLLPKEHQIFTLTFQNPEQLPNNPQDRRAVFDIACQNERQEKFIVEMQKSEQHYFRDRSLFYSTFPIQEQAPKGRWDYNLKAVYFVGVLDFEYDEDEERRKFIREVSLKDQDGDVFYEKLRFIFLQMPLFKKTESELETRKDKWFYFLKNLESFDHIPAILQEPIFAQAFETAEYIKLPPEEQALYEQDLKIYRDNFAVLETARLEGIAEGEARERAKAEVEKRAEKLETAQNLKRLGVASATISEATGLSMDEIERLN